jgi:hypothetical protein
VWLGVSGSTAGSALSGHPARALSLNLTRELSTAVTVPLDGTVGLIGEPGSF